MFAIRRAQIVSLGRSLHTSQVARHHVGPPDPVSNLRPVVYDDALPPAPDARHPYSLDEFSGDVREYQWKMQRQELDAYNQAFWTDVRVQVQIVAWLLSDLTRGYFLALAAE